MVSVLKTFSLGNTKCIHANVNGRSIAMTMKELVEMATKKDMESLQIIQENNMVLNTLERMFK